MISVVAPWFPSDSQRERVWEWLRARYAAEYPGWQVVEGYGGEPWCKADAVADGLTRASGDILIVADADVWADNLVEAVDTLRAGAPWVMPHRLVHRLSREATERALCGVVLACAAEHGGLDQPAYSGWSGGGVVVVYRDDYEAAPFDPRFVGWGQEDASLALALDTVVGRHTRLGAPLYHLWHPPQPRQDRRVGNPDGEALWRRYRKAARNRARILDLIDEGRR